MNVYIFILNHLKGHGSNKEHFFYVYIFWILKKIHQNILGMSNYILSKTKMEDRYFRQSTPNAEFTLRNLSHRKHYFLNYNGKRKIWKIDTHILKFKKYIGDEFECILYMYKCILLPI